MTMTVLTAPRLGAWRLPSWRLVKPVGLVGNTRVFWGYVLQCAGVLAVLVGVSAWSTPCALILGGLVTVAAVELQPPASGGTA